MRHITVTAVRVWTWTGVFCVALSLCTKCETALATGPDSSAADEQVEKRLLRRMPAREITVFKDGHALVLQEGELPVSDQGEVYLDVLPTPVMGTFWPYVAGDGVKLGSVVAARRIVRSPQAALNIRDLLKGNLGAKVQVKLAHDSFIATIVSIPSRDEKDEPDVRTARGDPPPAGEVIVLSTAEGYRVIPLVAIQEVTFLDKPNADITVVEEQDVMTLQLRWADGQSHSAARVGMVYLQKGIRWIPQYKLALDGQGQVKVKLQATLINEMLDLENVTANLVIGVPSFAFKDTLDPISLGRTTAALSSYFQEGSQTAYALSNAIQTQVARMSEFRARPPQPAAGPTMDLGAELPDGGKREDLFVFTVKGISLKKGGRMVLPVVEFALPYEDVYTLEIPMTPPAEVVGRFNNEQQQDLARLFHAPKVAHQARLTNRSEYPLTTAPALVLLNGQLLGQAMMTYTPAGGRVDVKVTTAVDISVARNDAESKRTPNAANWHDTSFDRLDMTGEMTLHNYRAGPATVEVVRYVIGNIDSAGHDGIATKLDMRDEAWQFAGDYPHWWGWYNWPSGWFHLNGVGRITWQLVLAPGESVTLPYQWHYYWR